MDLRNGGYTMINYKVGNLSQDLLKQLYETHRPILVLAYAETKYATIKKFGNKYYIWDVNRLYNFSVSYEKDGEENQIWLNTHILNTEDIDVNALPSIRCEFMQTDETSVGGNTYEVVGGVFDDLIGAMLVKGASNAVEYIDVDLNDAENIVIE